MLIKNIILYFAVIIVYGSWE